MLECCFVWSSCALTLSFPCALYVEEHLWCFHVQVLEGVIKYRWNALPVEQRDGMKNYISEVIVKVILQLSFLFPMHLLLIYYLFCLHFLPAVMWWSFFSSWKTLRQQIKHYIGSGNFALLPPIICRLNSCSSFDL